MAKVSICGSPLLVGSFGGGATGLAAGKNYLLSATNRIRNNENFLSFEYFLVIGIITLNVR